jgi:hypothetical protein
MTEPTKIDITPNSVKRKPKKKLPRVEDCELALTWMKKNPRPTYSMLEYYLRHLTPNQVKNVIEFLEKHQRTDVLKHLQIMRHAGSSDSPKSSDGTSDSPGSSTESPESPKTSKTKNWTRILQKIEEFHFPPAEAPPTEAPPLKHPTEAPH